MVIKSLKSLINKFPKQVHFGMSPLMNSVYTEHKASKDCSHSTSQYTAIMLNLLPFNKILFLYKMSYHKVASHLFNKNCIHKRISTQPAFSLVEMLMALLVASLLMAALAPVMTKKFSENVNVSGGMSAAVPMVKRMYEIEYGTDECSVIKTDSDGSEYCEGEYSVPSHFSGNMKVTVIGAGGGGGTAVPAGYTEYKTSGSTNNFVVPALVNKLEATLISGGAGGGAGGQVRVNHTFVTNGNGNVTQNETNLLTVDNTARINWGIPAIARGKYALLTACGGGGGGGGSSAYNGGGGGSGAYFVDRAALLPNADMIHVRIGGGGGGGGGDNGQGRDGHVWDAGGGGSGIDYQAANGSPTYGGGIGGYCINDRNGYGGVGGNYGGATGGHAINITNTMSIIAGGAKGGEGGTGGDAYVSLYDRAISGGGGGGGGSRQGGGGGGAPGGSGGGGGGITSIDAFFAENHLNAGGGGGGGGRF